MKGPDSQISRDPFCRYCGALTTPAPGQPDTGKKKICWACTSRNLFAIRMFLVVSAFSMLISSFFYHHVYNVFIDRPYPWYQILYIAAMLGLLFTKFGKKYVSFLFDLSIVVITLFLVNFLIAIKAGPDDPNYQYFYLILFGLLIMRMEIFKTIIHSVILLFLSGVVLFSFFQAGLQSLFTLLHYRIFLLVEILAVLLVKFYQRRDARERKKIEKENLRNDMLRSAVMKSLISVNNLMIQQKDFQSTLNQIGKISKTLTGAKHVWLYFTREPEKPPDIYHLDPVPEVQKIAENIGFKSGNLSIEINDCPERYAAWEKQEPYIAKGMAQYCEGQFAGDACQAFQNVLEGKEFISIPFMKHFEKQTYYAALTFVYDEDRYDLFVLKLFVNSFGASILLNQAREERKQAYMKLEKTHNELKDTQGKLIALEKSAQIASIAAGVSHDINNPLGALQASVDLVQKTKRKLKSCVEITEEFQKIISIIDSALNVIQKAMHRISAVVNALRNFSQLDRARITLADINEGIENIILLLQPMILSRVRLEKDLRPLPRVKCNLQEINQVVMNLLINAIEASPKGGTVRIRTYESGNFVNFEVSDSGPGISDTLGSRIYDSMFSTKENHTGMGLTIARDIVTTHGGRIEYHSEGGQGAVFKVVLPGSGVLRNR